MATEEISSNTISLRTSDNVLLKTNIETVRSSIKILTMLEEAGNKNDKPVTLYLEEVNFCTMKKVLDWTSFHKNDKNTDNIDDDKSDNGTKKLSEWDSNYLNVDPGTLFEILLAAEFLDIRELVEISANKVVSMIRGQTVEKIRENFHIRNDFSKEEEDLIRKENQWCDTN